MQVDFYLLNSTYSRLQFACRLLEKAYLKGHTIFVFCHDKIMTETLDELLWTFKEDSFIPHNIQGEGPTPPPPIQIGYGAEPRGFHDILLNLAQEVPTFFNRFQRVMEIVAPEEEAKVLGRAHYQYYRQQGLSIQTHVIEK